MKTSDNSVTRALKTGPVDEIISTWESAGRKRRAVFDEWVGYVKETKLLTDEPVLDALLLHLGNDKTMAERVYLHGEKRPDADTRRGRNDTYVTYKPSKYTLDFLMDEFDKQTDPDKKAEFTERIRIWDLINLDYLTSARQNDFD